MNYSELISKRKQYKYSANICFDLENEDRISGFIPNVTTTEILKEYLCGIIQENEGVHSRILYGSYGTGKSHLLTVLCALLGHINTDGEAFKTFVDAIERYDAEFADFLREYSEEEKPYLVVPVYSDFSDFDKCISFSLKRELEKQGFEICFKNYFYEAMSLIDKWCEGDESCSRLTEVCDELDIELDELKKGLANFENISEKKFNSLFQTMTFGASFVSEAGNLIDNIELANETIIEKYRGIVFVFDEFGRYIEDNGENIKVKVIQDFAEYCDHCDYDNHLILVSHKQLSLYTEKMKKDLSDEWKKIEGRFKATSINIKYDQCLSLIPHIIPKTKKWDAFKKKYSEQLEQLYEQAWDFKGFLLPPEGGNPFEGGYPLHPITLYSLDRLSKKVAQNERTFFTYLASDEDNSLFAQLKKIGDDRFHFVGLDQIYDYFEENIKSFRANDIYIVYKKLQFAINKLGENGTSSIENKILKVMAVINIISDTTVLAPNASTLCHVIDDSDEEIISAIENLEQKKIIKYMRQYGYYDFLDSSIYDLDSMIEERIPSISDDMVTTILNEEFTDFAIYPHKYNFSYRMNRILAPVFTYKSELVKKSFLKSLPAYYDGVVAFVLDSEYSLGNYSENAGMPDRVISVINTDPYAIISEVKRYIAVKYYYAKREELKKDDPTVEKELLLYLQEERAILGDLIEKWKSISSKRIVTVLNGEECSVKSEVELSNVASELMQDTFPETIIVNNDLINKNNVSGAIKIARNKVLSVIIENKDLEAECQPLSPEHTIIRSVLTKNGLYNDGTPVVTNMLPTGETSGASVIKVIKSYMKKAQKSPVPLLDLYKQLKTPPYGLRDGYISVLVAYELGKYENVSLSFHGADRDYCVEEFVKAFESPEDYSIYICNWDEHEKEYIVALEDLFSDYINTKSRNRLKDLLMAMNTHFAGISKSARTTERYVSAKAKQYRDILSVSYKDYNGFFFDILPQINTDLSELIYTIGVIKKELESVLEKQMIDVEKTICGFWQIEEDGSIAEWLQKRYEADWKSKSHKVFDYQTNAFLDYLKTFNARKNNKEIVCDIAKTVTGFELEYWNDSKLDDFGEALRNISTHLDEFEVKDVLEENEVKIIIQAGSESAITTQFDKKELSGTGQVMFNKMKATLDNFGMALTQDEKMQIIARLLEEIV